LFGGEKDKIMRTKNLTGMNYVIDPNVVKQAIKILKPRTLMLFGYGEPTLSFEVMKHICDSIDTGKTKVHLITNGVYSKERKEIIKYIVEKGITLQISFDGNPKSNDSNRILTNGTGSSGEVLSTINELKKYGPLSNFSSVRVTVCKGMERSIMQNTKYLSKLGFRKIIFEPVSVSGRASKDLTIDINEFAVNLAKAVVYAKEHKIEVISRILPSASNRAMARYGCGFVAGHAVSLSLNNSIYLCNDPLNQFKIGDIVKSEEGKFNVTIDKDQLGRILSERDAAYFSECEDCPVKCGGGCARESLKHYKNFEHGGESTEFCEARRLALFELLKLSCT
jgi:uncharacterized protein